MKAKFKVADPDRIEVIMEITMTLTEWTELSNQLAERWPSWDLNRAIKHMRIQYEAGNINYVAC